MGVGHVSKSLPLTVPHHGSSRSHVIAVIAQPHVPMSLEAEFVDVDGDGLEDVITARCEYLGGHEEFQVLGPMPPFG